MGTRIGYEIGHPAAVTLYSNSSHPAEDPEIHFRALVREFAGRPTSLVAELLELTYQTTAGSNRAGDPLFNVDLYPGDREYVLIANVEEGTVIRREVAPIGLAQLPTSFEASVGAFYRKLRVDASASAKTSAIQILKCAQQITKALAVRDNDQVLAHASALNLELIALLCREGKGLMDATREAFIELQSSGNLVQGPLKGISQEGKERWMPGSEVRFGNFEFGILYRDEGDTLQVVVEEGFQVEWKREMGGIAVQVTHAEPSPVDMHKHCKQGEPYRGFTCTIFEGGKAEFWNGEAVATYSAPFSAGWELEAWAGVKVDIDRTFMH